MSEIVNITAEDIKSIRKRHGLTQVQLAKELYHIKADRIPNWESGRRHCPPIIFWAMVLTLDKVDLYNIGIEQWRREFMEGGE